MTKSINKSIMGIQVHIVINRVITIIWINSPLVLVMHFFSFSKPRTNFAILTTILLGYGPLFLLMNNKKTTLKNQYFIFLKIWQLIINSGIKPKCSFYNPQVVWVSAWQTEESYFTQILVRGKIYKYTKKHTENNITIYQFTKSKKFLIRAVDYNLLAWLLLTAQWSLHL